MQGKAGGQKIEQGFKKQRLAVEAVITGTALGSPLMEIADLSACNGGHAEGEKLNAGMYAC